MTGSAAGAGAGPRRLKVMTVVGTRPELIKLSRVVAALERETEHVLVHTGQNYDHGLSDVFFEELELPRPRHYLAAVGATPAESIGLVIARADRVIADERPDALLVYGDTNSALAAIAAKRRKVPVFHMEAGNRCFDERVPEEINRRILDHVSDVNMTLTEHARRLLVAEGLPPARTFKTGSCMGEVLEHYRDRIEASTVVARLGLEVDGYLLVSAHREENVDPEPSLRALLATLDALARSFARPVVVSTHPRTRRRLEALGLAPGDDAGGGAAVRFLPPFGYFDYVALQRGAYCVLSDSGTLTEEASLLDLPAVALREAHERPEGVDVGAVVLAGLREERVLQAVRLVRGDWARGRRNAPLAPDYAPVPVSRTVVRLILGYVDVVRREVWRER